MLKADWTKKDSVIANELGKYGRTGIPLNLFLKTGQPPAILSEALTGTEVLSALSAVSAGKPYQAETTTHSFAFWMLLAFGGGILLNLMPCVFPMIGLKVLGFAKPVPPVAQSSSTACSTPPASSPASSPSHFSSSDLNPVARPSAGASRCNHLASS
jgi:thiol:disulfide interchange protein